MTAPWDTDGRVRPDPACRAWAAEQAKCQARVVRVVPCLPCPSRGNTGRQKHRGQAEGPRPGCTVAGGWTCVRLSPSPAGACRQRSPTPSDPCSTMEDAKGGRGVEVVQVLAGPPVEEVQEAEAQGDAAPRSAEKLSFLRRATTRLRRRCDGAAAGGGAVKCERQAAARLQLTLSPLPPATPAAASCARAPKHTRRLAPSTSIGTACWGETLPQMRPRRRRPAASPGCPASACDCCPPAGKM